MKITQQWPEFFLDPLGIPAVYREEGTQRPKYPPEHTKIVGFRQAVKALRGGDRTKKVESTFYLHLPDSVEEQFTNCEGHPGVDIFNVNSMNVLHLEMMGVRSNYTSEMPVFSSFRKVTAAVTPVSRKCARKSSY